MEMAISQSGVYYTVPWAISRDIAGQYWLRLDYPALAQPGGTVQLEVSVLSREMITCRLLPGQAWEWKTEDVSHWQRHGLVTKVTLGQ